MLVTLDTSDVMWWVGACVSTYVAYAVAKGLLASEFWVTIPKITVDKSLSFPPSPRRKFDLAAHEKAVAEKKADVHIVKCWDPATLDDLGEMSVTSPQEVEEIVQRAKKAQKEWAKSSFAKRRQLLRTLLRWCVEDQETIATVACRDSGKTLTDAVFGEILVTCEKLKWLTANAEEALKDDPRAPGTTVMFTKTVHVEYRPLGVIGAIVPWNYPFHNVLNPTSAALAAGDSIIIKVSEYASWSTKYYDAAIKKCLRAVNAPEDLVQFVHGYAATGKALVESESVDKIIFVGSPEVGKLVMKSASESLKPVVLELGGKDPFVICDDVKDSELDRIAQIALRGVFQSMGQNCAGPERFLIVGADTCDKFCHRIQQIAPHLKVGSSIEDPAHVDCGAITMGTPALVRLRGLVDDAVKRGAKVVAGGSALAASTSPTTTTTSNNNKPTSFGGLFAASPPQKKKKAPDTGTGGSFFAPTVLRDVPFDARIAREEIFGPVMCVFEACASDDEAIYRANDCGFALSSCAFAQDPRRARRVASELKAGMSSVNDLEGTTYLSQSLPFGGLGLSGFDRFAGVEGLRGLCSIRSVCEDKFPRFLRTAIPAPMQYPSKGKAHVFAQGVVQLFYGFSLADSLRGIFKIIRAASS